MKKIILFASFGTLALIITLLTFVFFMPVQKNNSPKATEPIVNNPDSKVADSTPNPDPGYITGSDITGYMMKSENSLIHIYEMYDNGNTQLIESLNINPETLPDADKKELTSGIVLTSYEKMLGLIEDYSS